MISNSWQVKPPPCCTHVITNTMKKIFSCLHSDDWLRLWLNLSYGFILFSCHSLTWLIDDKLIIIPAVTVHSEAAHIHIYLYIYMLTYHKPPETHPPSLSGLFRPTSIRAEWCTCECVSLHTHTHAAAAAFMAAAPSWTWWRVWSCILMDDYVLCFLYNDPRWQTNIVPRPSHTYIHFHRCDDPPFSFTRPPSAPHPSLPRSPRFSPRADTRWSPLSAGRRGAWLNIQPSE